MDGTVRDMLHLRGVRISPVEGFSEIIGFRCLGVAEKIPDFENQGGSLVHIWHVSRETLPVSVSEAERWLVDAPPGRHWILSEREFSKPAHQILSNVTVEFWGPEKLARWIGESVLRGDMSAQISLDSEEIDNVHQEVIISEYEMTKVLSSKIDLEEWLIQRGMEHVDSNPVLLQATIWTVHRSLISPSGLNESHSWRVLEDPWAEKLELHDESEMLRNSPNIRLLKPQGNKWLEDNDLRTMLIGILETRRQKEDDSRKSVVRSTMLERWEFDYENASLERTPAAIPGWILKTGGVTEILHSRNGRSYDINFAEEP